LRVVTCKLPIKIGLETNGKYSLLEKLSTTSYHEASVVLEKIGEAPRLLGTAYHTAWIKGDI